MIIPAIIAKDFEELKGKLSHIDGLVAWAQIDVMDGVFVPSVSWNNPEDLNDLNAAVNLEVHLMVSHPENSIDGWLHSPVKRILLHYESTNADILAGLLKKISDVGKVGGVVLKLETPLWVVDFLIDSLKAKSYKLKAVQLMAIAEIGYHGHPFEEKVLERIRTLHEKYQDVTISVDGGVNLENTRKILDAGADNLMVGSIIFKIANIKETLEKFNNIQSEH